METACADMGKKRIFKEEKFRLTYSLVTIHVVLLLVWNNIQPCQVSREDVCNAVVSDSFTALVVHSKCRCFSIWAGFEI